MYEYTNYDGENEKHAKIGFENSIASLGDKYAAGFKDFNLKGNMNILSEKLKTKNLTNQSLIKVNKVFIGNDKKLNTSSEEENFCNLSINIPYLKSGKLEKSEKYKHIKSGKINPPKSNFSIKPVIINKIKHHEDKLKNLKLYASPVRIYKYLKPSDDIQCLQKNNHKTENIISQNENNSNNFILVGTNQISDNINNLNQYTQPSNTISNVKNKKVVKSKNNNKNLSLSRESRNLQKKYENLYSDTKDFFISNINKVPSKKGIEEIIQKTEDMEKTLEKYKKENFDQTQIKKHRPQSSHSHYLKDSNKNLRKLKNSKSPKKNYFEIDENERKKIEEKLENLHLEIRTTFDNLCNQQDKDVKMNDLIKKCRMLSNILKSFSKKIGIQIKPETIPYNSINQKMNMSPNITHSFDPFINRQLNQLNQNNLNHNSSIVLNKNEIDDVINTLKSSVNANTDKLKDLSANQSKSNTMDKMIDMMKGTMSNLQYDDNKMIFDSSMYNTHKLKQSEDVVNTNSIGFLNFNKPQIDDKLLPSNNENYITDAKNTNPESFNRYESINQKMFNNKQTNEQFFTGLESNYENIYPDESMNRNNVTNTNNSYINPNDNPHKYGFYTGQDSNYAKNTFTSNVSNQNTMGDLNIVNAVVNTKFNPNESSTGEIKHDLGLNTSISPYAKINTKNVTTDDRFASYDIELPFNYYCNITKMNEPKKSKDWFIRPHHIETISKNSNSIGDDIMNTKYISYYGPSLKSEIEKTNEEKLNEIISTLQENREKLQIELFKKANLDKDYGKLYKKLESLKEEVKKEYQPGKFYAFDNTNILPDIEHPEHSNYSNKQINQTNMAINGYSTILEELRNKEKSLILLKRKEELERVRPPVEKWWEIKGGTFQSELLRNKKFINATPDYFEKLTELQSDKLY